MPRKIRLWYEDAQLHITSRGNHRNDIFRDESDFEVYLKGIEEAIDYYNGKFEILSYCLMTNHVHLQVQTTNIHIKDFIRRINGLYAMKFNDKYNYVGHLFQGRYGSEIIENDQYVVDASRYIHLNPVKANMVEKAEDYKWSSYSMIIGDIDEKLIISDKILNYFTVENKREAYKNYVQSDIQYGIKAKNKKTKKTQEVD
ncbi:transposase [Clostridium grantii]|uniref:REP element-mobilizing transposase RayT n=1 Tax=Clostridium grantii DSM 8605 TaxID=1121316 RepID=A0A1M5Y3X7_9CLOT|nr:transposase [Clostridium grantii]SHI06771.1 REP element-mobilizing transposase RayT [Clostridium grantii DSM 8605]